MIGAFKVLLFKLRYNNSKAKYPYHFNIEPDKHQLVKISKMYSVLHSKPFEFYLTKEKILRRERKLHNFFYLVSSLVRKLR